MPESVSAGPAPQPPSGWHNFDRWRQIADLVIKSSALLAVIVGGVRFYVDYQERSKQESKHQQQAEELRKKEFQLNLFTKQMDLYHKVCDATAKIALAPDKARVESEVNTFWELYWGELCMVEKENV